jgi:hypothetical protein
MVSLIAIMISSRPINVPSLSNGTVEDGLGRSGGRAEKASRLAFGKILSKNS